MKNTLTQKQYTKLGQKLLLLEVKNIQQNNIRTRDKFNALITGKYGSKTTLIVITILLIRKTLPINGHILLALLRQIALI